MSGTEELTYKLQDLQRDLEKVGLASITPMSVRDRMILKLIEVAPSGLETYTDGALSVSSPIEDDVWVESLLYRFMALYRITDEAHVNAEKTNDLYEKLMAWRKELVANIKKRRQSRVEDPILIESQEEFERIFGRPGEHSEADGG